MRRTCLDEVYELAKKDERVFFIGSDLGVGTLDNFQKEMPNRFFMEGISEAHIVGMASGLAMEGKIVYVNTISTFITRRCFDQVVLDACLHNLNIRLIGNGGGLVYAPLGPTHQAIEDMAIFRAIPNMTIVAPADATEMKRLMPKTLNHQGPIYIRLGKGGDPIVTPPEIDFEIGKAIPLKKDGDVLMVTTGITLKIVLEASEKLEKAGVSTSVLHMPTVKPIDMEMILGQAEKASIITTIEEGVLSGGLGSAVAEIILEANFSKPKKFKRFGIDDVFAEKYGSQDSLLTEFGISSENIVSTVNELLKN
jgi:transketolase